MLILHDGTAFHHSLFNSEAAVHSLSRIPVLSYLLIMTKFREELLTGLSFH